MAKRKRITRAKYKKRRRMKSWVTWVLTIFFLGMIVFASYQLYQWHNDNQNIKKITKDINDDITPELIEEEGELVNPPAQDDRNNDYWNYIKLPFYQVDFSKLLAKNADTVAFIHMDNTNINYPVVQSKDNKYYLTHAFDGSNNDAGWVFMDYRNSYNPMSDNLVIYGHGRLDTTVFGSLKNVLTKTWQNNKDNYVIWLSTPSENLLFQIFSVYTTQSESYYITTDFSTDEEKQAWINTMLKRNIAPINTQASIQDTIITLSTCENNSGGRIVVHAKLIKRQQK